MKQAEARERIEKLRREIEEHNHRYYVLNQPSITDFEYDILMHELESLEKKFDSLGVDGILVVTYKGTDKSQSYIPPTTTVYPDYYYNYYNYYNWGYPLYGAGANVVTTGGYWVTSSVINLEANLYSNSDNGLLWQASISVDDPQYIDQTSYQIAAQIYADWAKNGLLKGTGK